MAFPAAQSYSNLPNGDFSPVIFSQKAIKAFRKTSVVEDITNTDYFGEIANYGDSVRIIKEPDITVSTYARGQTLSSQALSDDDITLTVDQANKFQFQVDDIEVAHSHVNWEELASNRAAYKLKDAFDANVLAFMADNAATTNYIGSTWVAQTETVSAVQIATGVTPNGSTIFTPLGILSRVKRLMDVANVPADNRWMVADPVFYEQLGDEESKFLDACWTGADESPVYNGKLTNRRIRGFEPYESNNLPAGGTGPDSQAGGGTNYGTILFGHRSAVATVSQILKTEKFRSPDTFADVVRGLHVFGRGYIRPDAVWVVRYATKAAPGGGGGGGA